ncbi:MAG TPA: molybdopterin-dependent oxidoreductase [Propionibacteriaceae bacterium]|nr:molybdopterin-dependent oxidoreductase [Propionibacteriaceae bacterium]
MTATIAARGAVTTPPAPLRALAGVLCALAAVGVGHGVAGLIDPVASPILAVGSTLIDAAPTPAKEFAVRTFGTYDKPILIGSIGAVLLVFAATLGLIAWRRRLIALIGISLLGVAGLAAAVFRDGPVAGIPSLVAGAVGVLAMLFLTRQAPSADDSPTAYATARSRRTLLLGSAGVAALAAVGGAGGLALDRVRQARIATRRALGLPAPMSPAPDLPAGVQVEGVSPFTTPLDRFYRVDISLVTPRIDASTWSLRIDGMVDNPTTLSYDELLALPLIERDITLTCVSNEVGGPYVSTGRWLGVPFAEIIRRVGVRPGVDQVFSYSSDSGFTCSTPYAAVSDGRDAMVVVGLNGEVLPDARGFPARMLVPGLYGFVSATKWLERIEFTTYAERTAYWTERDWATEAPILTQSRIEVPKSLATLPKDRPMIAGVAWAQRRGIAKVEIRIDEGEWQGTTLAADGGIDLWRQWSFRYDGPPGLHSAQVRATDLTGTTQPEQRTKVFPRGATGWHQIQFTAE